MIKTFFHVVLITVIGIIIGSVCLIALLYSFVAFLTCFLVLGVGGGFLLAYRFRPSSSKRTILNGIAYAIFLPIVAFIMGPGLSPPLPFFYSICFVAD